MQDTFTFLTCEMMFKKKFAKKKKKMSQRKMKEKKNLGQKNLGKKNFSKKNLGKKKIWVKKIDLSCLSGGDTQKSCLQSKFEAKRLKITPFLTERTFWDPKLPHSHMPINGEN